MNDDDLQTRIERLRLDLGNNVERTVENARAMFDWRHYVSAHPWLCLTAAAAAGFLVVPRRARYAQLSPDATAELASRGMVVVKPESLPGAKSEIVGNFAGAAAKMAMRMVVSRLTEYVERRLREGVRRGQSGRADGEPFF